MFSTIIPACPLSLPCATASGAAWTRPSADVLASIAGKYVVVHAWDAAAQGWRTYNPALPPEASTLHALGEKTAFWILMTEAATLTVDGTPPSATSQALYAGWNLIAYPSVAPRPVAEALASIVGTYTVAWAY